MRCFALGALCVVRCILYKYQVGIEFLITSDDVQFSTDFSNDYASFETLLRIECMNLNLDVTGKIHDE